MGCLGDLVLGDHPQIVSDHTPADPASHPLVAVVATAAQAVPPFEPTDAPFDAGAPVAALVEPALSFIRLTGWCLASRPRQHHLLDPALLRRLFVGWARQFAIAGKQVRRASELLPVA